jgi:hypothetical protein
MDLDDPFDSPAPDDPYADFEYVVLVGFDKDPGLPIYPALEALGGVVLNERQTISAERAPLRRWMTLRLLMALLRIGRASGPLTHRIRRARRRRWSL